MNEMSKPIMCGSCGGQGNPVRMYERQAGGSILDIGGAWKCSECETLILPGLEEDELVARHVLNKLGCDELKDDEP